MLRSEPELTVLSDSYSKLHAPTPTKLQSVCSIDAIHHRTDLYLHLHLHPHHPSRFSFACTSSMTDIHARDPWHPVAVLLYATTANALRFDAVSLPHTRAHLSAVQPGVCRLLSSLSPSPSGPVPVPRLICSPAHRSSDHTATYMRCIGRRVGGTKMACTLCSIP